VLLKSHALGAMCSSALIFWSLGCTVKWSWNFFHFSKGNLMNMTSTLTTARTGKRTAPLSRLVQTLAAAALVCAAPLAMAQSSGMGMDSMGPGYIGLSGGPTDFTRISNGTGLYSRGDHDTAYSLMVGNYFLSPNLGMEAGYTNFGSVARGGGNTKAEGINISLIGKMPVHPSLNLLGKVGTTYGHTEVSSAPGSGVSSGSESGFDWSYGVGAELVINPQWSAVLQYDEHYMKFAGNSSERLSTTTIGVRMHY
jgi:hypothetical protein